MQNYFKIPMMYQTNLSVVVPTIKNIKTIKTITLSDKISSDKIFDGQNISSDKKFDAKPKFRQFCPIFA